MPVVIAVHGYTSTATGFNVYHGLNQHADDNGYVVVYPQGPHFQVETPQGGQFTVTSWNDLASNQPETAAGPMCTEEAFDYPCPEECGECGRCAWTGCYDDLGFFEIMLDQLQAEFDADDDRYYLLGVSNGGMMTWQLGCSMSDKFAAIAPIIGQLAPGYACGPDVDLPAMHLFGGEDNTVRYDGEAAGDGFFYTSATETASVWADAMACKSGPAAWESDLTRAAGVQCTAYSDCNDPKHEIVSCMDPAGNHNWPGQKVQGTVATCVTEEQYASMPDTPRCEPATGEYDGSGMDLVWDFFGRYRLNDSTS
jgi:polyhydroxybutyrate depolymerase